MIHSRRVYRLHERLVNLRTDHNLRQKTTVAPTMQQVAQVSQSSKGRPELDGVTLRYAQDLLAWVEENQRRINESEWGSDLPTVESNLGSHRGLHQSVEDFRAKIERAKTDEVRTRVGDPLVVLHVSWGNLAIWEITFNMFYICFMILITDI